MAAPRTSRPSSARHPSSRSRASRYREATRRLFRPQHAEYENLSLALTAIAVATIIAVNALILFRDSASFLIGRSPGPDLAELERAARAVPGVVNVRGLRAEFVGPDTVHAGPHIEVAPKITVDEGARIAAEVRARVHEQTRPGYCYIETDPAQDSQTEDNAASLRAIPS